jgi:hypothetical protein
MGRCAEETSALDGEGRVVHGAEGRPMPKTPDGGKRGWRAAGLLAACFQILTCFPNIVVK